MKGVTLGDLQRSVLHSDAAVDLDVGTAKKVVRLVVLILGIACLGRKEALRLRIGNGHELLIRVRKVGS